MSFSMIAVKLLLIMPKTNKKTKNKIEDQKNLLANFIFLKIIVSNIRELFYYIIILLL